MFICFLVDFNFDELMLRDSELEADPFNVCLEFNLLFESRYEPRFFCDFSIKKVALFTDFFKLLSFSI